MCKPDNDPSVFNEPHMQPGEKKADQYEHEAARRVRQEMNAEGEAKGAHSIYDEPAILPHRSNGVVEQDWSCSNCGYNLRGLSPGHPCPECQHIELYQPAPKGAAGYENWLRTKIESTSSLLSLRWAILVALVAGPWSILATFIAALLGPANSQLVLWSAIFVAPPIEEMLKIGVALLVVETRPYWFKSKHQILVASVGAALFFSIIENLLYQFVYVPNMSQGMVLWRWTACVALHVTCTLIAAHGVSNIWERTVTEFRPPRVSIGVKYFTIAMVIHGSFNAGAIGFEMAW